MCFRHKKASTNKGTGSCIEYLHIETLEHKKGAAPEKKPLPCIQNNCDVIVLEI
jgi:hypothetical protein